MPPILASIFAIVRPRTEFFKIRNNFTALFRALALICAQKRPKGAYFCLFTALFLLPL